MEGSSKGSLSVSDSGHVQFGQEYVFGSVVCVLTCKL